MSRLAIIDNNMESIEGDTGTIISPKWIILPIIPIQLLQN